MKENQYCISIWVFRPTFFAAMTDAAKSFCWVWCLVTSRRFPQNNTKNVQYNKINDSTNILQNGPQELFPITFRLDDYTLHLVILVFVLNTIMMMMIPFNKWYYIIVTLNYGKNWLWAVLLISTWIKCYVNKSTAMYLLFFKHCFTTVRIIMATQNVLLMISTKVLRLCHSFPLVIFHTCNIAKSFVWIHDLCIFTQTTSFA